MTVIILIKYFVLDKICLWGHATVKWTGFKLKCYGIIPGMLQSANNTMRVKVFRMSYYYSSSVYEIYCPWCPWLSLCGAVRLCYAEDVFNMSSSIEHVTGVGKIFN